MLGPTYGILGERTLVLNRSWMAITTTTVRRAISLVYQESARIICPNTYEAHDFGSWSEIDVERDDRLIRTVTSVLKAPEVIVLRVYDHLPKRTVAFSRRNLYRRDGYTCQYCGRRPGGAELTIDHVTPKSEGGRTTWENCVLACVECNKRKANRSRQEAGMRLRRAPRAPQWSWEVELSLVGRRNAWEMFLPRRNGKANGNGRAGKNGFNGHAPGSAHG